MKKAIREIRYKILITEHELNEIQLMNPTLIVTRKNMLLMRVTIANKTANTIPAMVSILFNFIIFHFID